MLSIGNTESHGTVQCVASGEHPFIKKNASGQRMITTQEGNEEMRGAQAEQSCIENKRRTEKRNKRGRETPVESERRKGRERSDEADSLLFRRLP